MKKGIVLCLVLCLMLCGCHLSLPVPTPEPSKAVYVPDPEEPAVNYAPYYTDPSLRSLQADVTYRWDTIPAIGRLNNLYGGWAQSLYELLQPASWTISRLSAPDLGWIRMAFSAETGGQTEVFTLYENNLVVTEHPTDGKRSCTAPVGTYAAVQAHLNDLQQQQGCYVTVTRSRTESGYTLYKNGKAADTVSTGNQIPVVELVAEGLVRVVVGDTTRLYDGTTGKNRTLSTAVTDVMGEWVAAVEGDTVAVYPLFETKPLCRIYTAITETTPTPVEGVRFAADGSTLHILMRNAAGTRYDRTVALQQEMEGSDLRLLGEWRDTLTPATEKEEQTTAYTILKKLSHRESEKGYMFSGLLLGHLMIGKTDYLLCEIGHWVAGEDGSISSYELLGHLMVPADLSAGYAATLGDNELSWDTEDNWFKK